MPTLDDVLKNASDSINIDFSGSEDYNKVTEPGAYLAEVTSVELGSSKAGNDVLVWKSVVPDGEELAGAYLPIFRTNIDGKAAFRTRRVLRALGYEVDEDDFVFSPSDAVGRQFLAIVERNGEYLNVEDYSTP